MAGKKNRKKEKEGDSASAVKQEEALEARTIEYYTLKMSDMTDKMERMKSKLDILSKENVILAKAQTKFYSDKQDIVEFLNLKVGEHERMIATLEGRNRQLEEERKATEERTSNQIYSIQNSCQAELESLNFQNLKLKSDLIELNSFSTQKEELGQQLTKLKALLEKKETEYRETIHNLERKVLQDKSQMKREMLQKVNEAVANFRKVADQQMAETTKRAIRENMSISTQLKKMSQKTIEFITENDQLRETVKTLQRHNTLLSDSEKELAKKSNANQKVIKMLIEKLKESDQMLELAFEEDSPKEKALQQAINEKEYEIEDLLSELNEMSKYKQKLQTVENVLRPEMIQEIQTLQDDYNELIGRMIEIKKIGLEFQFLVEESEKAVKVQNAAIVVRYIFANLGALVTKLEELTTFQESYYEAEENEAPSGDSQMNRALKEIEFDELDEQDEGQDEQDETQEQYEPLQEEEQQQIQEREENQDEQEQEEEVLEYEDSGSQDTGQDTQPSTSSEGGHVKRPFLSKPGTPRVQTEYQKKIHKNFQAMIAPKTNQRRYSTMSDSDAPVNQYGVKVRDAVVQTKRYPFSSKVGFETLLGELRPWGPKAANLPKKGIGLYHSRAANHLAHTNKFDPSLASQVTN